MGFSHRVFDICWTNANSLTKRGAESFSDLVRRHQNGRRADPEADWKGFLAGIAPLVENESSGKSYNKKTQTLGQHETTSESTAAVFALSVNRSAAPSD
jgi:hypothetical protein